MIIDKGKKIEIPLRIADHSLEVVDLKQAQITVIILHAFLLQFAALLRREIVFIASLFGASGAALVISQKRLAIVRPLPVGTAFHLHLEQAEIDPELQFFAAIEARNFAHFDRAVFVRPIVEERV